MTTFTRAAPQEILPPPSERRTVGGWLRRNLFNSWFNTILTLVAAALIFLVVRAVAIWAFTVAEWAVIPANWNLLMRGQYPVEEIWRLWFCIYLVAGVIGFSWGAWGRSASVVMVVVFAVPLLLMLLPWLSMAARLNLLITEVVAIGAFSLARFGGIRRVGRYATISWIVLFPLIILIIRGFRFTDSFFTFVPSNVWGGLLLSLLLAIVGIVFSFPIGVLLALGRQSSLPAIKTLSVLYIEFIRGVPLITLLFMAQVMLQLFLPASMPPIDRVLRAMVAITLFSAAYTAENVRGGLQIHPARSI